MSFMENYLSTQGRNRVAADTINQVDAIHQLQDAISNVQP